MEGSATVVLRDEVAIITVRLAAQLQPLFALQLLASLKDSRSRDRL